VKIAAVIPLDNGAPFIAGSDGTNAARQVARIATGWRLRAVAEPPQRLRQSAKTVGQNELRLIMRQRHLLLQLTLSLTLADLRVSAFNFWPKSSSVSCLHSTTAAFWSLCARNRPMHRSRTY
jgi:hypothetical protein